MYGLSLTSLGLSCQKLAQLDWTSTVELGSIRQGQPDENFLFVS